MELILIFILLSSTILLAYTTYNLLLKNEALEDVVQEQEVVIALTADRIESSMKQMKELDRIGSFEADDETGFIFKNMYDIISELEDYYGKDTEEEK